MSNGKPNFLKSILTLAMLSALEEKVKSEGKEHLLKGNKQFDELMAELDKIFGIKPKEPVKDTSGSMKPNKSTLFNDILNEISEDEDRDYLNSIYSSLKDAHKEQIDYIGKPLLGCEIKNFDNIRIKNTFSEFDDAATAVFGNERVFYTRIYGGFGLVFLGGSVHYFCFTNQPNVIILFDNQRDFYYGKNNCLGLKDKLKRDHLLGKLK